MSWKFAVSTLGIPSAPIDEAIAVAVDGGCEGLELRVHADEPLHLGIRDDDAVDIGRRVRASGLAVATLAGYVRVCSPEDDAAVLAELRGLIRLARRVGAENIRVFPGGGADPAAERDAAEAEQLRIAQRDRARRRIAAVLDEMRAAGVRLLVETHDSHPTGAAAVELVDGLADPSLVGVLWDGLHPWRSGEDPATTRAVLGEHCVGFQIKDAVAREGRWVPVAPGTGELPVGELAEVLRDWSGWVSFEWERAWHPQIEPLAEVLPAAAAWVRRH